MMGVDSSPLRKPDFTLGAGNKMKNPMFNGSPKSTQYVETNTACTRNLRKAQLGGVIFGCKITTIKECLFKQIFGLPRQHFSVVKNIDPGLPLFLFNYSDRKLHGIYEAASPGQMNINPYGWTKDGSEKTPFPAQVQIRVQLQCQPLHEDLFKPMIADNYYTTNHFWFELDHAQTNRLKSALSSFAVTSITYPPPNTEKWRTLFRPLPSPALKEVGECHNLSDSDGVLINSNESSIKSGSSDSAPSINKDKRPVIDQSWEQAVQQDEDAIYLKLKELALNRQHFSASSTGSMDDATFTNDVNLSGNCTIEEHTISDQKEESHFFSYDAQSVIAKMIREIEDLKDYKAAQIHNTNHLELRLAGAEEEIKQLKHHCVMLESTSTISCEDKTGMDTFDTLQLDSNELIYLVGGFNGVSWLSTLELYSPSHDVIKKLKPMTSPRAFASVAKLNSELYLFGGGNGESWYDTVESYNPTTDEWTPRPSLNLKRGSLAGVTLDDKIFAIGGGNGGCLADVEMFDADLGRWISTRSMLHKRFALGAAELNGVLYATGGYDGKDYLNSAERFDPREHSWTKIKSMNTKRGCHSLVTLNEKLYALGGFDGDSMIATVEIYDPRLGTWIMGEPMDKSRGYSSSVVVNDCIYVTGGLQFGSTILDTVECYKEGRGWEVSNPKAIGTRCYFSAVV